MAACRRRSALISQSWRRRPNSAWALFRLGEISRGRGDEAGAIGFFERAVALNPAPRRSEREHGVLETLQIRQRALEARNLAAAEPVFLDLLTLEPGARRSWPSSEGSRASTAAPWRRSPCTIARSPPTAATCGAISGGRKCSRLRAISKVLRKILEFVAQRDPTIGVVRDRLAALRKRQRMEREGADGVRIRHWPATAPRQGDAAANRPRLAVVAWCLAHNPVGRAMILADLAQSAHAMRDRGSRSFRPMARIFGRRCATASATLTSTGSSRRPSMRSWKARSGW